MNNQVFVKKLDNGNKKWADILFSDFKNLLNEKDTVGFNNDDEVQ